jgi:hypothetical protein
MLDDDTKDRFRPRDLLTDPSPTSLINEAPEYRDRGAARVLHKWPRQVPLRGVLAETLANVEMLLAKLESGVHCPPDVRVHYEKTVRELYLRCEDVRRVYSRRARPSRA